MSGSQRPQATTQPAASRRCPRPPPVRLAPLLRTILRRHPRRWEATAPWQRSDTTLPSSDSPTQIDGYRLSSKLKLDRHGFLQNEAVRSANTPRSEEHTSELQSPTNLVCRL